MITVCLQISKVRGAHASSWFFSHTAKCMKSTKYLLIGGGLASTSAAKALRKIDPDAPIIMVSDESSLPYNRPPLSKDYLKGTLARARFFLIPHYSMRKIISKLFLIIPLTKSRSLKTSRISPMAAKYNFEKR